MFPKKRLLIWISFTLATLISITGVASLLLSPLRALIMSSWLMEIKAKPSVADVVEERQKLTVAPSPFVYLPLVRQNYRTNFPPFGAHMLGEINDAEARTLAIEAGIHWARGIWLNWATIEPKNRDLSRRPRSGNWEKYDNLFADLNSADLMPIVTITGNPSWAASTSCGPIDRAPLSELAEFIGALAERYDGDGINDAPGAPVVRYWEFYNEPDNTDDEFGEYLGGCWGNYGREYAEMLRSAYQALKKADPQAKVLIGGLAYDSFTDEGGPFNRAFLDDVLANGGGNYFDFMNFHYHRHAAWRWDPYGPEARGKVAYLRDKLSSYGLSKPFVCTEDGEKHYDPAHPDWYSDERQSRYVVMSLIRGMAADLKIVVWFTFGYFIDNLNREWGLLDSDLNPRPAYYAYKTLTRELGGAHYERPLSASGIEGYVFSLAEGVEKSVLWATEETTTMSFPGNQLRVVDKYGAESIIKDGDVSDLDGTANGSIEIEISLSPIYVEAKP